MTTFKHYDYYFKMSTPEYEIPVFGGKVGELRLISKNDYLTFPEPVIDLNKIREYLITNEIIACTYRGREDIKIIQQLINLEFRFIGTYNTVIGQSNEFSEIKIESDLKTLLAQKKDFKEILNVESKVFDYSTFQIDPLFPNEITSHRNVLRVKSYFDNPYHNTYILKQNGRVAGFLQFIVDKKYRKAECVNGAIDPKFQGLFVGPKLYSDAFKEIFNLGIDKISGGYSTQNIPVSKIFKASNFKIVDQEIHLRLNIKKNINYERKDCTNYL